MTFNSLLNEFEVTDVVFKCGDIMGTVLVLCMVSGLKFNATTRTRKFLIRQLHPFVSENAVICRDM